MKQKLTMEGLDMGWTIPESEIELYTVANSRHIFIPEGLTIYQACRLVINRLLPEELYKIGEKLFFQKMHLDPADEVIEKVREDEPDEIEDEEEKII